MVVLDTHALVWWTLDSARLSKSARQLCDLRLQWDHRDPADRTIVATAQLRDLPLVSIDAAIRAYYPKTIW